MALFGLFGGESDALADARRDIIQVARNMIVGYALVGLGYGLILFVHRLLLEYFVALDPMPPSTNAPAQAVAHTAAEVSVDEI